uniref:ATP-dependent DNA helicase n=1 Tax=Setaria italica TaxID=4555 RepID=K4AL40_SETIT
HVVTNRGKVFFVDGPGGTGKTYLYRALLAKVRFMDLIAITTVTSGIAASIMPGGRTAHSRFKIPIKLGDNSVCNFTTSLIIWDEVAMTRRQAVETLDRSLQDIMGCTEPFGETYTNDYVQLPVDIVMEYNSDKSIDTLIEHVFPDLKGNCNSTQYMHERAILSTRNEHVDGLNARMIDMFPGKEKLMVRGFEENAIDGRLLMASMLGIEFFYQGYLCPLQKITLSFKFKRKHLPIRLSFAMTINKAKGVSRKTTWVLAKPNKDVDPNGKRTKNIVYRDVLEA